VELSLHLSGGFAEVVSFVLEYSWHGVGLLLFAGQPGHVGGAGEALVGGDGSQPLFEDVV
jgi:hypothetical protein